MTVEVLDAVYVPEPAIVAVTVEEAFTPVALERNVAVATSELPLVVNVVGATVSAPAVALLLPQETVEALVIKFPPYCTDN